MVWFKTVFLPLLLVVSAATLVGSWRVDDNLVIWTRGMLVEKAIQQLEAHIRELGWANPGTFTNLSVRSTLPLGLAHKLTACHRSCSMIRYTHATHTRSSILARTS